METGPDLQSDGPQRLAQRGSGLDGAGGSIEGREKAVTRRVELPATEPRELPPDDGVVLRQKLSPRRIAEAGGKLGRTDDVGEEDRGEDPVLRFGCLQARDERGGRGHRRLVDLVVDPGVEAAQGWQLDELGT